jgi:tRNA G26 N,N-dimethylase Trm1
VDERAVAGAREYCFKSGWRAAADALAALEGSNGFPPYGYSMAEITSRERVSSVRFQRVVDTLTATGRRAMRQPFGSSGLKTDAPYDEVLAAVRESAR